MNAATRALEQAQQRRDALAAHLDAVGYPNAAAVVREADDLDAGAERARRRGRELPLESLPGMELEP